LLSPGWVWRRTPLMPARFTSEARPATLACSAKPHSAHEFWNVQEYFAVCVHPCGAEQRMTLKATGATRGMAAFSDIFPAR
jgi:hypothetical protein